MTAAAAFARPFTPIAEYLQMAQPRRSAAPQVDAHRRGAAGAPTPLRAGAPQSRPWNVLRVTPGMERKVAAALGPKSRENPHGVGLNVYVPLERYQPANARRPRHRPLIPGYIFAELPDDRSLDLARANHAVRDVMCLNGVPLMVAPLDIGSLILAEACRQFDTAFLTPIPAAKGAKNRRRKRGAGPNYAWRKGQRVRIELGAFAGFVGEIVDARRADRMELLVSVFGRATPVTMDEGDLSCDNLETLH